MANTPGATTDLKYAADWLAEMAGGPDAARHLETYKSSGGDIDAPDMTGQTALHLACMSGNYAAAEALLNAGADKNAVSTLCMTPLSNALVHGHGNIAKLLLARGADPDQLVDTDTSPLSIAASGGDADMVRALLSHKASLIPRDPSKDSPAIVIAAREGHLDVLRVMIEEFKVPVDTRAERSVETPLTASIVAQRHAAFDYLVAQGADIQRPNFLGLTPIYVASCSNNVHAVEELLDRGVSIEGVPNDGGSRPLMCAAAMDAPQVAKVLLERGADIDAVSLRDSAGTARDQAVAKKAHRVVELIDGETRRRHVAAVEKDAAHAHSGVVGTVKVRRPINLRRGPAP